MEQSVKFLKESRLTLVEKIMKMIGEGLWVHEDAMNLIGTKLRLRMTIVKLANGGLWIHSPTALSPELKAETERLGSVRFIVGASNGHNIWLRDWQSAFPDALLYVSAGIPKKLKLPNYQILDESFDNLWKDDLEHVYVAGVPFFNESVFLHKQTKSLIVTDFIQNHFGNKPDRLAGRLATVILESIGFKGICVAPPLKMGFIIKDKPQLAQSINKIKTLDFERIIVTHGDIIESDAKKVFDSLCERFFI